MFLATKLNVMQNFSQFKQSLGIQTVDFYKSSTGRQVATVSTLSNMGQRVKTTIIKAKNYDIKNPNKFIIPLDGTQDVFILCNSKLTAGDAE